jgi:ribonuclease III
MIGKNPYRELEKRLGYRFRRRKMLETALTHRSFRFESDEIDADNQRMEFLGDAALGLVTGSHLFRAYPDYQEGDLTSVRSSLTNTKILGHIAAKIELGSYLRLGRGEIQTGGHHRLSNLSDALEAVIGAAYLDGGIKAVEAIFKKIFLPEVKALSHDPWSDNPKGALQELAQRKWHTGPRYRTARDEGPPHARVFTIEVLLQGQVVGIGRGNSKRHAEMEAAREALKMHKPSGLPATRSAGS